MKKVFYFILLTIVATAILFAVTNPTLQDFKEYAPSVMRARKMDWNKNITLSRHANYILYSEYVFRYKDGENVMFSGYLKNFHPHLNYYFVNRENKRIKSVINSKY